ncbi:phage portal protein [Clostridium sporogenes]
MAFKNIFKIFKEVKIQREYAKMLNGSTPIFSQFGEDIYASDIVQNCIRCIVNETSKLQPKHIRTYNGKQNIINSSINRLLKYGPNDVMTTTDFLEKITYLREINKNCFIYPKYKKIGLGNGTYKREYIALYPLNPTLVEFLEDMTNRIFVRFTFKGGGDVTLPYDEVIHWRKDFGANDLMGGDINGQPNNEALLKLLKTNDTIIQGIDKGIKSSLSIRGLLKINTMLSEEKQNKELEEFEKKILDARSGILPIDLKSEYIPLNVNPKFIDKETMEFIDKKILNNYGVSLAVLNGDFTEEQYQSFYEKTLEPMIISLGRAFSKVLFTTRELDFGNEIIFYSQGLMFTNMKNKIAAVDVLSSRGTLTDNQILEIFGFPPFEGGDVRHMSLNYINRDIADAYQMSKSKVVKETKNE